MSVFTQFIQLRDKLAIISENNNDRITGLLNQNVNTTGSCQLSNILMVMSGGYVQFTNQDTYETTEIAISDFAEHLSDNVADTSLKVSDFLSSLANSSDLYAALSSISAKFSYTSRMTLTDVNSLIDGATATVSSMNYDVADLKQQLVACSDSDGFITSKAWLVTLNGWFDSLKTASEDNVPELDTTAPNTLAGLYGVISTIINTVITALFNALAVVFSGIVAILANVISSIFSAARNYIDDGGKLNVNCANNFVKGPIAYWEVNPIWYSGFPSITDLGNNRSIWFTASNGIANFFWLNKDKNRVLNNAYLYPCFHYAAVSRWISGNVSDNGNTAFRWLVSGVNGSPDGYFNGLMAHDVDFISGYAQNTDEEEAEVSSSINSALQSICVDAFYRYLINTPTRFNSQHPCLVYWNNTSSTFGSDWKSIRCHAIEVGAMIVAGYRYHGNPTHYISQAYINEAASKYLSDMYSVGANPTYETVSEIVGAGTHGALLIMTQCNLSVARVRGQYDHRTYGYSQIITWENEQWNCRTRFYWATDVNPTDDQPQIVNCLPQDFGIEINGVTISDVVNSIALTTLIATASAITLTKVAKVMRQRKILKSTLRTKRIAELREAYMANPSDKQTAKAYAKEVDKYNRMGRILGWGSYDAANDWIDAPNKGESNATLFTATTGISSAIQTRVTESLFGDASEPDDITTQVNGVKGLINALSSPTGPLTIITNDILSLTGNDGPVTQLQQSLTDLTQALLGNDGVIPQILTCLNNIIKLIK